MKPITRFTPMLAIALTLTLLLALAACRPDELADYGPGNPNPGTNPAGPLRLTLSTATARPQFEEDAADGRDISYSPPVLGGVPEGGGSSSPASTRALPAPEKSAWADDDRIYFRLQLLGGDDTDGDGLPDTAYSPWDGQELTTENVTTQGFAKNGVTIVTKGKEKPNSSVGGTSGTYRHYLVGVAQYNGSAWSITSLKAIAIYATNTYGGQLAAFKTLDPGALVLPAAVTTLVGTAQYAPAKAPHWYAVDPADVSTTGDGLFATGIPVWQSTCTLQLDGGGNSGSDGSGSGNGSGSSSGGNALSLAFRTWTPLCARLRINTLPGLKLDFQGSQFSLFGGQRLEYTTQEGGTPGTTTDNLKSYDPATGLPARGDRVSFAPDGTGSGTGSGTTAIKSLTPDADTGDLIFYVPLATDAADGSTPAPTLTLRASGAATGADYGFTDDILKDAGLTADASASTPPDPIFKVSQLKLAQAKGYKVDALTVPAYKLSAVGTVPRVKDADGTTIYLLYNETTLQKFDYIVMGTKTDGSIGDGGSGADYSTDANLAACTRLMADIQLTPPTDLTNGSNWTPLGNDNHPYTGTFDGQGHTVSGLVINRPGADYQGFFGCIGKSGFPATVKNLTVEGTVTGKDNVGGIVGSNGGSTLTACTNTGSVTGTGRIGGVAGYNGGTLTACTNTGSVTGTGNNIGGIAGNNNGPLTACTNTGSVTGTDNNIGGVAGYNSRTLIACTNTGSVTGTGSVTDKGDNIGGIAGYCNGRNSNIITCYNMGSVTGRSKTGGVAGRNDDGGTLTACYSTGSVTGTGGPDIGGVVGYHHTANTVNCYWQSFGPGNRPNNGIGGMGGETGTGSRGTTAVGPNAYNGNGTLPSWFTPATTTPGSTDTPANKMNAALGNNPAYRYVENPAYAAALAASGAPDYDTPVPPLLLEQVPAD